MTRASTQKLESPPDLFFAFPDGVYDYNCAECTALCCKGHGFGGSLDREMRALFVRYPQIESMAYSRNGDQINFATTAAGCVMLDTDNFCRIEKELGKGAKPNICNLFPFNVFSKIGKTVVVMPHFLCPLRAVLPARPGEVQGTHALIAEQIFNSRMLDRNFVKTSIERARLHASVPEATVIDREKSFLTLCSSALGSSRFIDVLKKASTDPPALAAFIKRARGILGYDSSPEGKGCDALDDMLLAFASPYRIGLLDLPAEGILRALAVAELLVRSAWRSTPRQLSFHGVASHVATFRAIQVLLAFADASFEFGKVTQKSFSFLDAELTFAAFIAVQHAADRGVLGALEQAVPPNMSVSDRSILLMRLGKVLQRTKSKRSRKHGAVVDKIISSQENGLETESIVSGGS